MYQLPVQVAPYIKKFVDARLGSPVVLHNRSTLHITLATALFQSNQLSLFGDGKKQEKILPFTVMINSPYVYMCFKKDSVVKARIANNFFETLFLEEMDGWIKNQVIYINRRPGKHNIKYQLASFCHQYNIVVEEDITEDALIKMYYRYRKWYSGSNCPLPVGQSKTSLLCAI